MSRIQDLRNDPRVMRPATPITRPISSIRNVVRHHSGTDIGDKWIFSNHWRNLGWLKGGYHEIILRDGTVQLIYPDNWVVNGALNHNPTSYHICLVGNGNFTPEQERAFDERARAAMQRFNLPVTAVVGHNELPGHASNRCPGINMITVRNRLGAPVTPPSQVPATPPVVSGLSVQYSVHVQNRGWVDWRRNGELAGTTGQSLQMEGIRLGLANAPAGSSVICRAHVQSIGWQGWVNAGAVAGTTGQSRQMEAIQIVLVGPLANTHDIEYRVHMRDLGWGSWVRNGTIAGTTGQSRRIEAIEIRLVRR